MTHGRQPSHKISLVPFNLDSVQKLDLGTLLLATKILAFLYVPNRFYFFGSKGLKTKQQLLPKSTFDGKYGYLGPYYQ